eukprot:1160000-Pelagomonas_calceolata.AAC.21
MATCCKLAGSCFGGRTSGSRGEGSKADLKFRGRDNGDCKVLRCQVGDAKRNPRAATTVNPALDSASSRNKAAWLQQRFNTSNTKASRVQNKLRQTRALFLTHSSITVSLAYSWNARAECLSITAVPGAERQGTA